MMRSSRFDGSSHGNESATLGSIAVVFTVLLSFASVTPAKMSPRER
jgi:hypothetical protein